MSRPESMEGHKLGTELRDEDRRYVLRHYTHRYTGNHRPLWSRERRPNGEPYPLQFANDRDWLANTFFRVRKNGRLEFAPPPCEHSCCFTKSSAAMHLPEWR